MSAYIDTAATLKVFNAATFDVSATSTNNQVTASALGVAAEAGGVAALVVEADLGGSTTAYIGGNDTIDAAQTNLTANANNTDTVSTFALDLSVAGASAATATANLTHQTSAYTDPAAQLTVNGTGFDVTANATNNTSATSNGGAGGGITAAGFEVTTNLSGSTSASLGGSETFNGGTVDVSATGNNTANASTTLVDVSLGGGVGANVTASLAHNITAQIEPGANIQDPGGNVTVQTGGSAVSDASATGGNGGAVSVSVLLCQASTDGTIKALVGVGATVTAGSLSVLADTNAQSATADANIINIGILGSGAGASTTGTVNTTLEAFVGPDLGAGAGPSATVTTLNISGALTVAANSANSVAESSTDVGSGGLISGAGQTTTVNENATTLAYLGDGIALGQGIVVNAGTLAVTATAADAGTGESTIAGGGGVNVTDESTTVTVQPAINAHIGQFVLVNVSGDVNVDATSQRAEGHATANNYGGGGIQVGIANANATSGPTVRGFIDTGSQIIAGGSVTVDGNALSLQSAQVQQDKIQAVDTNSQSPADPTGDSIQVNESLNTGDYAVYDYGTTTTPIQGVTLDSNGNTVLTNLGDDRSLPVIVVGMDQYQLGDVFDGATAVDPAQNVIQFSQPDGFRTGDAVQYIAAPGSTSVGGLTSGNVYYLRVISPTSVALYSSLKAALTPPDVFNVPSEIGTAFSLQFGSYSYLPNKSNFVNGQAVTYEAPPPITISQAQVNAKLPNGETTDIYLGAVSPYQDGDLVEYFAPTTGAPIGGLNSGSTYEVVNVQSGTIQLEVPGGNVVQLTPGSGRLVQPDVGGLTSGQTYYVVNVNGNGNNTFGLATAPNGNPLLLDGSHTSGNHLLIPNGIVLTPGSGPQNLHLQFFGSSTSTPTGDLLLPAQANGVFVPPVGTGQSSADAEGGSGGIIDVSQPSASLSLNPNVQTYVNAGLVSAGQNVTIASEIVGNSKAHADNAGGGLGYFGSSEETSNFNGFSQAAVGSGATINAVGAFSLTADTQLTTDASGHSDGGGFIATAENDANVNANNSTTTTVGANAQINAATVNLMATDSQFNVSENPSAIAGGLGGDATADSESNIDSTATVTIAGGTTTIEGADGVDVRALNENLNTNLSSDAHFYGLFGGSSSPQNSNFALTSNVIAGRRARQSSPDLVWRAPRWCRPVPSPASRIWPCTSRETTRASRTPMATTPRRTASSPGTPTSPFWRVPRRTCSSLPTARSRPTTTSPSVTAHWPAPWCR